MKEKVYIGLDIGGTKCAMTAGCLNTEIDIKYKERFATEGGNPSEILKLFSDFIDRQSLKYEILSIGIACGGPLDSKRGIIMKPPSLSLWDNIHIKEYFEEKYSVPVYLQNDANASAVAEWKYGNGKGCENMIFLTFGTGLGAGLILGGRLYVGKNDNAGEIGHVRLTPSGPVGYNKAGSAEGYCSGSGIRRLANIMADRAEKRGKLPSLAATYGKENLTAEILANAARSGDKFARAVFKKSGEMLGRTFSVLIDLFNPEKIILGGVYMRCEDLLYPHARKIIEKESLPCSFGVCEIAPAKLGEKIGDVSALSVAMGDF